MLFLWKPLLVSFVQTFKNMSEQQQLKELNEGMRELKNTLNGIESALLGGKFHEEGLIMRVSAMEKKFKRMDRAFYVLLGSVTLGAYPMAVKLSELIKPFILSATSK